WTPRRSSALMRSGRTWGLTSDRREGQTFGGESLFVRYMTFVKLPHTIFALPFALLGVIVASYIQPVTWRSGVLVVIAFTAARFVAMGFNRIADRRIDARNPRTQGRELPAGRLTVSQAWAAVLAAMVVFLWAAWALNPLWVALAVMCWVAGFDIFYALQDETFDRSEGLRSVVVRMGQGLAIIVAKLLHGAAIAALILFGKGAGLGLPYFAGVMLAVVVLGWEHRQVKPGDLSKLNAVFFTANGIVSIVVFVGALVDRIL